MTAPITLHAKVKLLPSGLDMVDLYGNYVIPNGMVDLYDDYLIPKLARRMHHACWGKNVGILGYLKFGDRSTTDTQLMHVYEIHSKCIC